MRSPEPPGGSSPRVRGAVLLPPGRPISVGVIPAGAGSRSCCVRFAARRRGHPRGCGEQADVSLAHFATWGSSPRVRGAVFVTCEFLRDPAHFEPLPKIPT
ncbi:hypothetical protein SSAG_02614 [Streptomyces sp. Mg1]|nr:hypothetical protein SSAG_02614 [Streptomyces sp. Mg1]